MTSFTNPTRRGILAGTIAAAAAPSYATAVRRPVLVELFTSQGCSSCPPADALLRELVGARADILALAYHVTYWDRLGWPDPYALEASTRRQREYAAIAQVGSIYTPQMVVDGRHDVVGSDRRRVLSIIARATEEATSSLSVQALRRNGQIEITLGTGAGPARVLLVGYDAERQTRVARGENAGRTLVEANIVRAVTPLGDWTGTARTLTAPTPAGERHAVIVQAAGGKILGAVAL